MPAAIHHDEDFINKSLLASLDAQADAEPNNYRSSFRPRPFYQQDPFYPQYDYQHFPVQLSSQTPYGPHVPAGIPPPPPPPIPSVPTTSTPATTAGGEEISTIFVVGFPEDMSEREFQNMFTFSPGFEAATLKIPNKEYTAYNGLLPSASNPSSQLQRAYPTDPYNVVLDGGRDGMPSWPATQHDDLAAHHYNLSTGLPLAAPNPNPALAASSSTLNLPQRKQIIGFAKFRTREEALSARDVLQGRRVDIEKGAVLKAEMAKKNLHTKRGVGPVPGSLPPSAGGPSNPAMQIQQHDTSLFGPASDFAPSSLPSSSQQNSIPALSRLGWRDSVSVPLSVGSSPFSQQQIAESSASNSLLNGLSAATSTSSPAAEDDRKRDSTSTSLLTLGGLSTGLSLAPTATPTIGNNAHQLHLPLLSGRGARERAAAEDDEQQWRRREENLKDMKLRAMDSVAYDAFHRVSPSASNLSSSAAPGVIGPASGISRQSSSSTSLSLSTPLSASTSNTPWTPNSVPTTAPSGDSESGRKLDDGGAEEENIELESEVNRRREEDDDYETLERRDFRDEQGEHERGTEERLSSNTNVNVNLTNATTTTTNEIVGPWDRINAAGSYAAVARSSVPATAAARTRTGSERSTSPPPPPPPSSSFSMGPNLGMNGASSSHQHLGLHQQQYSNQFGYHQSPQPSQQQVQSQSYQNQYQHLHMHQQQMLQQQQQQREREAFMHQYQQQQQYRSTQSESGESNGDPTSSTNPAGYVGAGTVRLGMLNTNTNGNGHGTSPNSNGNGNGIPPPPVSSASSSSSMTLSRHQPAFPGNGVGVVGGASGVASAPSSGSTSSSSNNGGNTSPQLPSPTSGGSSGGSSSSTSLTSAISVGGGGALRGTVDQNPPINTLYVGNLPTSPPPNGYPADHLEDVLREVFSSRPGYRKLCFRHKANGPMCFVEFEDVHFAAKALSEMSGNTLRGVVKNGIRLSYSKNPLGVRTPTSAGGNNGGPTLQQQQQLIQTLHHAQYQQQQQQGPSMMQHYSQPPPPSSSASSNGQDTFHSHTRLADDFAGHLPSHHHRVQLPTSILRRDSALSPTFASSLAQTQAQAFGASPNHNNGGGGSSNALPNGGGGGYFSSPPPRFYTTSPPGMTSTPLTGASTAFVPRSSAAMANGIFGAGYSTAFSPFGVPFASGGTGGGESGFGGGHPQHIPGEQQQHQQQQQQHQQQSDD